MRPESFGPTTDDPVRVFLAELPPHARHVRLGHLGVAAVHALARDGADLTAVAEVCGRGTERRSREERGKIALFRLLRAADRLDMAGA